MSNTTSPANLHASKNQTALKANTMHNADLNMGTGKLQGDASHANPHAAKNQTALEANTMHNADLNMGASKVQREASHLNRPGVLQTIRDDHRAIEAFYNQAISHIGDKDGYTRWSNQFMWQVGRHSISEELTVYPELEKHLGEPGRHMAESDRGEHQYVKDRLKMLESMESMSEGHIAMLKDVMDHLKTHMKEEEEHDFPRLEEKLSDSESAAIAKSFERTKGIVPTRAHPNAPSHPPFESVVGMLTMPIDKLRDMVSKFPSKQERDSVAEAAKIRSVN
jgi:hemerythrin superfamily protein